MLSDAHLLLGRANLASTRYKSRGNIASKIVFLLAHYLRYLLPPLFTRDVRFLC